jgi:glycosyltransferase involved in cell wall biosynthesis
MSAERRREDVRIAVVMPAMNAARTLEQTVAGIPPGWADDVILVDDKSTDETVEVARKLPIRVIWHPHNVGYGGNQKTCYLEALQSGADIVVMRTGSTSRR